MLALFGIGKLGKSLYYQLKKQAVQVDFVLDNYKVGDYLDGAMIVLPSQIDISLRTKTTVQRGS
jgi:hypothetical protein